jgi:hypothetical protein
MTEQQNYHGRRTVEEIVDAIYKSYEADDEGDGLPWSIRPSSIGNECGRSVQLAWMWVTTPKKFDGRMLGLFEAGKRAEDELIRDLKRIGWEVIEKDPAKPTKQWQAKVLDGHCKGYLDGIGRDRVVNGPWMLLEMKSHNNKSFNKTKKYGVAAAKPEHFAQMQLYMHVFQLEVAVYSFTNKDSSEKWKEYVDYDAKYIERLLEKGSTILGKRVLLPRISNNPDYFMCRYCDHRAYCHEGKPAERNCRTCEHSRALADGAWGCNKHQCAITRELMKAGCAGYQLNEMLRPTDEATASSRRSRTPAQAEPASEALEA